MRYVRMIIIDTNKEPDFVKYMDKVVSRSMSMVEELRWYKEELKDGKVRYLNGFQKEISKEDVSKLLKS